MSGGARRASLSDGADPEEDVRVTEARKLLSQIYYRQNM